MLVSEAGHIHFALGGGQFRHILVGLFGKLLDLGAQGIVVEELVAALLDRFVNIGEIGTETCDGVEDSGSKMI